MHLVRFSNAGLTFFAVSFSGTLCVLRINESLKKTVDDKNLVMSYLDWISTIVFFYPKVIDHKDKKGDG